MTPKEKLQPAQLSLLREVLEVGASWSVQCRDGASFQRYLSLLAPLYDSNVLGVSPRRAAIQGLHLLNLLVTGQRPQYYSYLARLPDKSDEHIRFVVQLEQCLVEGTFHRLLVARQQVPAQEYIWFVDSLLETVRLQIAEGIEIAFTSLEVSRATSLLLFADQNLLIEFATKKTWMINGNSIKFPNSIMKVQKKSLQLTSPIAMIEKSIFYAKELEQII